MVAGTQGVSVQATHRVTMPPLVMRKPRYRQVKYPLSGSGIRTWPEIGSQQTLLREWENKRVRARPSATF